MSNDPKFEVKCSNIINNQLLCRKQCKLKITHPGAGNLTRKAVQGRVASLMRTKDENVLIIEMNTQFGGGVTTAYALCYNDPASLKKFTPAHLLLRYKLIEKVNKTARKTVKIEKNKRNKFMGTAKDKGKKSKK